MFSSYCRGSAARNVSGMLVPRTAEDGDRLSLKPRGAIPRKACHHCTTQSVSSNLDRKYWGECVARSSRLGVRWNARNSRTSSEHLQSALWAHSSGRSDRNASSRENYRTRRSNSSQSRDSGAVGLIPTAVVRISRDGHGPGVVCRAILDTGSEINIISQEKVKQAGLVLEPANLSIQGIAGQVQRVNNHSSFFLHPRVGAPILVRAHVSERVTAPLPSSPIDVSRWPHIVQLGAELADPCFHRKSSTDMLLGSEVFMQVIQDKRTRPVDGSPWLLSSRLGHLVMGLSANRSNKSVRFAPSSQIVQYDSTQPASELSPDLVVSPIKVAPKYRSNPRWNHIYTRCRMRDDEIMARLREEQHKVYRAYLARELRDIVGALRSISAGPAPDLEHLTPPPRESKSRSSFVPVRNLFSVVTPIIETAEAPSLFSLAASSRTLAENEQVLPSPVSLKSSVQPGAEPGSKETNELLRRMFEIEDVGDVLPWTPAEHEAEAIFVEKTKRSASGRFVVPLPFAQDRCSLGASRPIALRQLFRLEAKLARDSVLRAAYLDFMRQYIGQGHMRVVEPPLPGTPHFYMPHHAVHRAGDPPEKIRVVFNASQRSSNGRSLNEVIHVGPKLQQDICTIIIRFRSHKYVFIADIRQMFRQIDHFPEDQDMLRIVWRESPSEPVQDFALTTVTYGTASAPFLANRTLKYLADSSRKEYPAAAAILDKNTYVDDVHGGGESVALAVSARDELIQLLSTAGFELRKWASNEPRILSGIPSEFCLARSETVDLSSEEEEPLKLLGVAWNPSSDSFLFKVPTTPFVRTKRELASQVGRIYDPAGWVMPVSVFARCIQREVCHAKYDWDDPLPTSLVHDWSKLASSMNSLTSLCIPRHISSHSSEQWLVGFADASERAYACVIYHVCYQDSQPLVRLVISRARIAPIKQESIPRLELLAAELLGKTVKKVRDQFNHIPGSHLVACSDSSVVLSWLTADPAPVWKVFVGNRVAKTLENIPAHHWFHVRTEDNPADVASRGALPAQLVQNSLWWDGPEWFRSKRANWPIRRIRPDLALEPVAGEIRSSSAQTVICSTVDVFEQRFSSFSRLRRVVAWIRRFIRNCRGRSSSENPVHRTKRTAAKSIAQFIESLDPLTTEELRSSDMVLVRRAQERQFKDIFAALDKTKPSTTLMKQLAVFRGPDDVLRVGGRLAHCSASFETQHPALVPAKDVLTTLLVRQAHEACLHVGPRATLAHLRTRFWIVNGRSVVSKCLSGCTRCFSVNPRPFQPEMGQLPTGRVQRSFTFDQVGIDFAGPFQVSIAGLRGTRHMDMYLAVFVCFATKAVHLEVVMDLSTDGFMQCLERFMGRRGVPSVIWSDNGRNFVGSANLLGKIRVALEGGLARSLTDLLAARGTQWKFIPPRAPHFGGLWEAAVKSAKRLIKLSLRGHSVNYQTFSTIIVRVEAVLNSRPLVAQSSSPDDVLVLTPGHFLVQRPLTALPESEASLVVGSRLTPKWKFVTQVVSGFWKKWSKEYLLDLQVRAKWNTPARAPVVGDIVLIMEDNTPPLTWHMGVITELHPGKDGTVRVATVRTSTGLLSRPLVKLCPLPKDDGEGLSSLVGECVRPVAGRSEAPQDGGRDLVQT